MRLFRAAAAAIAVLVIVIAPPVLLLLFIGNPYPAEGVDLASALTDDAILGLLAVVVWIAWAQLTLGLVVEAYAAVADRSVQVRLPVFGIQQDLARVLIGAVISTSVVAPLTVGLDSAYAQPSTQSSTQSLTPFSAPSTTNASQTSGTSAGPTTDTAADTAADTAVDGKGRATTWGPGKAEAEPTRATSSAHGARSGQPAGRQVQVSVRRGDSLWSLAESYLGDGDRWSEIAAANAGRTMSDGTLFSSADQIRPGWVLAVPGAAPVDPSQGDGYLVEAGDTLWDIAEDQLGDATRYPEIFTASRDSPQPGGEQLEDPDVIDVGWTLMVPSAANTAPLRSQRDPNTRSAEGDDDAGPGAGRGSREGVGRGVGQSERESRGPNQGPELSQSEVQSQGQGHGGSETQDEKQDQGGSREQGPQAGPIPGTASSGGAGSRESAQNRAREADRTQDPDQHRDTGAGASAGTDSVAGDGQPWMLTGLTGSGMVLAGGLLLGLRARRRAQFRNRRPGRTIAGPSAALAGAEKSITASTRPASTVSDLDDALRCLAAWSATTGTPMPALAAVELTTTAAGTTDGAGAGVTARAGARTARIVLHLSAPASLPAPWRDEGGSLHWSLTRGQLDVDDRGARERRAQVGDLEVDLETVDSPYPLLATAGATLAGDVWLLNYEELGGVRITGDAERGGDFVRYLVAELATNPWSHQAHVDCIGIASEAAAMSPGRISFYDTADATGVRASLQRAATEASRTATRAERGGGTTATGRSAQLDDDTWPAQLIVLAQRAGNDEPAAAELIDLIRARPGTTATAVLLVDPDEADETTPRAEGPSPDGPEVGVDVHLDVDGRLFLAAVGLELEAVGLSGEEAEGCAALLAQADTPSGDVGADVPVDTDATEGWAAYADRSGALRRELTDHRTTDHPANHAADHTSTPARSDSGADTGQSSAGSLLPLPAEEYVRRAAITEEDLEVLAPLVPPHLREEVHAADPDLESDLEDWFDQTHQRPRLRLLGPVLAEAYGKPLIKQRAYVTELLAFLALNRNTGVTTDEVATAFGLTAAKARDYLRVLRSWLGENPRTGQPYLPSADAGAASQSLGVWVYQIDDDVLVDLDLFARLRLRGEARGADGIEDLRRALQLVSGRPFDKLRESGWTWLVDTDRPEHYMASAVADVAFLLTAHSLERGDLAQARAAAEIGALAAPNEEATRLSLVRVCEAEGNGTEAERILREEVCNRTDDDQPPPDLSERTAQIIRNHQWLRPDPGPDDRGSDHEDVTAAS